MRDDERHAWSRDVAWVDSDDQLVVALLPDGPVAVLTGADALLEHMHGSFTVDELVAQARANEASPETVVGIRELLASLMDLGLVVSARPVSD